MYGIYYFSGTGNTKSVAGMLNKQLESVMYSIEEAYKIEDEVVIMYPVHGFGVPRNVLEFALALPVCSKKVYIISTAADFIRINHYASFKLIKILEQKGYRVIYDRLIVMPANFVIDYPNELKGVLYEVAKEKIAHASKDIHNNMIRRFESNTVMASLFSKVHNLQSTEGAKNYHKYFKVADYCTNCMICVENCPMNNIDETINFGENCVMCLRCVYNCPVNAIYSIGAIKKGYSLENKKVEDIYKMRGFYKHFIKYVENIEI